MLACDVRAQEEAQQRFTEIGNAYEILSDERASYDQVRHARLQEWNGVY